HARRRGHGLKGLIASGLIIALCVSGCATGWTVDAAKEDQLSYLASSEQARTAMAAKRSDGTPTWLLVRDVERFNGRADSSTGRLTIRRGGRKALLAWGGILAAIGLGFSAGGIAVIASDYSSAPCPPTRDYCVGPGIATAVLGFPLSLVGGVTLLSGAILIGTAFVGAPTE